MESSLSYILRRLLWVPAVLFVVSFATFALARFGPGDPVRVAAGNFRDEEAFARIRAARGLDDPIYQQYYLYMKDVILHFDFGESFRYRDRSVNEVLFPAIWRSMQYNVVAMAITVPLGLALGIFAARRQGTWMDPTSISTFLVIQSVPALIAVPFAGGTADAAAAVLHPRPTHRTGERVGQNLAPERASRATAGQVYVSFG